MSRALAIRLQVVYRPSVQETLDIQASLKVAGLRATAPRVRVLSILEESQMPLSVADIARLLKGPRVDQVTIYRTLESFVQAGLVHHVELHQGRSFFELATRGHHHHLVCRSCGRIEDVDVCDLEEVQKKIAKKTKNFSAVTSHALEFFGDCNSCVRRA